MEALSALPTLLQALFGLVAMLGILGGVFAVIAAAERQTKRDRAAPMRTANSTVIARQVRDLQRHALIDTPMNRSYTPAPHWTADQWARIEHAAARARGERAWATAQQSVGRFTTAANLRASALSHEAEVRRFAKGAAAAGSAK